MDDAQHPRQPQPLRPDLAALVVRLNALRDALEETALALNDYQCTLDSEESRAATLLMVETLNRAKSQA